MARPPNPDAAQRLLDAARATFAAVGLQDARVQDIAAAAGFSKAAFYLYFESKEAVFDRLVAETFSRLDAISEERHDTLTALVARLGPCTPSDWREGSARLQAFAAHDHEYNLKSLRAMWEERDMLVCILDHPSGTRRGLVDRLIERMITELSSQLHEARSRGLLRADIDGELMSEMIIGVWMQLGRRMTRLKEPPDFGKLAYAVDRFVSEGVSCRPETPKEAP